MAAQRKKWPILGSRRPFCRPNTRRTCSAYDTLAWEINRRLYPAYRLMPMRLRCGFAVPTTVQTREHRDRFLKNLCDLILFVSQL
eukprot:scaffold123005_cov69-Phaeocystis_antarctica.AAC.1